MKKLILLITLLAIAATTFALEDVVIKYNNKTAMLNKLASLGLSYHDGVDGDGNPYRTEDFLGTVSTPHLLGLDGYYYFTTRLADGDAQKFPSKDVGNPAFAIVWRGTELCDDVLCDWPLVEVQAYDIDGNPSGTRMQGVGRIR